MEVADLSLDLLLPVGRRRRRRRRGHLERVSLRARLLAAIVDVVRFLREEVVPARMCRHGVAVRLEVDGRSHRFGVQGRASE